MTTKQSLARLVLLGAVLGALASCATVREKTETYVLTPEGHLIPPVEAWLRTVEIVSNNLPLSDDYALIRDSLTAIASKHGIQLSATQGSQPYIMDLVIHERSYAVDLVTSSSVMAVLNVNPSTDDRRSAARVVYSAVTPDSVESLYQVAQIGEKLFASLSQTMEEEAKARAKAEKDAKAADAKAARTQ